MAERPKENTLGRFYDKRIDPNCPDVKYLISIMQVGGQRVEIEVPKQVYDELDDLQREYWRQEKSESRHTRHIEMMRECDLPHERYTKDPEQLLIEQIESLEIQKALHQIPLVQQRRFLLRHFIGLSIKQIAWLEGCSERAVNYSLIRARDNLQEILS